MDVAAPTISLGEAMSATQLLWTTGGTATWFVMSGTVYEGSWAVSSGLISHNQTSWLETTVTGTGMLTYYWKVSSESGYDFLRFYIDGVEQAGKISGETGWAQKTFPVGGGPHALRWNYTKDGSASSGSDCGWVDLVTFLKNPPSMTGALSMEGGRKNTAVTEDWP